MKTAGNDISNLLYHTVWERVALQPLACTELPGFAVGAWKSYAETPPGGGKCAPLTRPYAETPLGRPFGAPQKGAKKVKNIFSTLPCDFLGARAPLRGAGRPCRAELTRKSYAGTPPPGVNVRPLGRVRPRNTTAKPAPMVLYVGP